MYSGIVAGNNNGNVWVDNISNPAFCMVWSEYLEGFHFMGSRCNHINKLELQAFIEDTIIPFLSAKGISCFEFSCDFRNWMPIICEMLPKFEIKKNKQHVYRLANKNNINTGLTLPGGYELLSLASDSVAKTENYEIIKIDLEKAWGNINNFLRFGKGFAAIKNNQICSFTSTHFLYNNIFSFGTETYYPHKKKGLSGFLSVTLLNSIINQGADIWWDCMESNIASQKTAQKVGLTFDHEYEVGWFKL